MTMSERILIMVKNKVVLKERDAWSDLANFIGEMVAKYAESMDLDNLPDPDFYLRREIIHAKGIDIGIYTKDFENEYISLTDIAKYRNDNDPRFVIQNWMRNRNTVEFLAVWEELHNPDFNRVQFEAVRSEAGLNRFVMTPTKWIEQTNAIGIVSKAGRYDGGTYAHSDIAMAFATWISPEF